MWQIMWILSLLPDWFYHLLTITAILAIVASWVLKYIPFINTYRLPILAGGILCLALGLWMEGGIANEAKWQAKVQELEEKIREAEAKSEKANDDLEKARKEKVKVVKEVQLVIQERIRTVEKKIDAECKVAPEAVSIHNDAARNVKGDAK